MEKCIITHNNWSVENELYTLFKFILPMFEDIFGPDIMAKEPCSVYVDTTRTNPILVTSKQPIQIALMASPSEWWRVVFQLAHELTHYAVRQCTDYRYKTCAISAFEEPAASAITLYILKFCTELWCRCEYCQIDPDYTKFFEYYRNYEYVSVGGNKPNTYKEWLEIDAKYATSERPDDSIIRNHLYDTFIDMPNSIATFIRYTSYLCPKPYEKLIDESKWVLSEPESAVFIKRICEIQPTDIKKL